MRTLGIALLVIAAGSGCREPERPPAPRPSPPPATATSAPVAATATPAPAPPPLDRPPTIGCSLLGERLWEPLPLRLEPEGDDLLEVGGWRVEARVSFFAGEADELGAFLELAQPGVTLRAFTDPSRLRVFVGGSVMFGRIAVPYRTTPLRVVGQHEGDLVVRLEDDASVDLPAPLDEPLACDQLTLLPPEPTDDAEPFLRGTEIATLVKLPLPLSSELNGAPVASLLGIPPRAVLLAGRAQGQARIAIHGHRATYVGWVPGAAVQLGGSPSSPPGTHHESRFARSMIGPVITRRCTLDLPLLLTHAGEPRTVGHLAAGTIWRGGPP
ncbi:MAG: hypothetical protein KC731_04835, partial [Myxococcales bacterium]|nr:hypothetical protein [Myxococcales bacterium]